MAEFWLGYLDEAYTRTHYRIGVVLIAPRHVAQATILLREVLDSARNTYALTEKAELHGYELFHGDKEWEPTKDKVRARIGVYRRALHVVADHADAVVICGEHLDGQSLSPRDRHQQVMAHVIADMDEFADVHDGHVLLIADDHEMVGQLRDDLALYQRNRPDSRVIDTIHFVSSVASPLVQAADLATFITRRAEAGDDTDERARRVTEGCVEILQSRRWRSSF